jgi:hypothetical protein
MRRRHPPRFIHFHSPQDNIQTDHDTIVAATTAAPRRDARQPSLGFGRSALSQEFELLSAVASAFPPRKRAPTKEIYILKKTARTEDL